MTLGCVELTVKANGIFLFLIKKMGHALLHQTIDNAPLVCARDAIGGTATWPMSLRNLHSLMENRSINKNQKIKVISRV